MKVWILGVIVEIHVNENYVILIGSKRVNIPVLGFLAVITIIIALIRSTIHVFMIPYYYLLGIFSLFR